jgi:hypothetical protein
MRASSEKARQRAAAAVQCFHRHPDTRSTDMKTTTFRSFAAELEDAAATGMRFLRSSLRTFSALPWPALLLAAILTACAITVIPLALMLFAIFLAIKYAVLAINSDKTTPLED